MKYEEILLYILLLSKQTHATSNPQTPPDFRCQTGYIVQNKIYNIMNPPVWAQQLMAADSVGINLKGTSKQDRIPRDHCLDLNLISNSTEKRGANHSNYRGPLGVGVPGYPHMEGTSEVPTPLPVCVWQHFSYVTQVIGGDLSQAEVKMKMTFQMEQFYVSSIPVL